MPDNVTKSKKIELLIACPNRKGIIHVTEQVNNKFTVVAEDQVQGVSFFSDNDIVPFTRKLGENEEDSIIGEIAAFAISSSKKKFCAYRKDGSFFIIRSNLSLNEKEVGLFHIPDDVRDKTTKTEIKDMLSSPLNYQLLFCGDDSIILSGLKYILLTVGDNKTLFFKMTKKGKSSDITQKFVHCTTEVDGVRAITNEGVYIISQVPDDVYKSCYTFSEDNSKKLMKAYNSAEEKKADCDSEIRSIIKTNELHKAVKSLQNAAANLWKNKEQLFMLKARYINI